MARPPRLGLCRQPRGAPGAGRRLWRSGRRQAIRGFGLCPCPHPRIPTFRCPKLGVLGSWRPWGPFQQLVRPGLGAGPLVGSCPVSICDHLPASCPLWTPFLSLSTPLSFCLGLFLCVSLALTSIVFLHFSSPSPHIYFWLCPSHWVSFSSFLPPFLVCSLSLSSWLLFIYRVCFPSRSERLGHGEVFPLGECPALGPGVPAPHWEWTLASCHPGPLKAVLPGLGKAGLGSVQSQAPAGAG